MASTVTSSVSVPFNSTLSPTLYTPSGTPEQPQDCKHHTTLLVIHSMVLFSGTISLSLMMYMMKSSITSSTSIAVLNLIFTHFIYLLTVPFRIYYHAVERWSLGSDWCRVVSSMIHIHMYMSFLFYVIILVSRLVTFYRRAEREVFNYLICILVILVSLALVALQANAVRVLYRKHQRSCTFQHDFGAHLKSLCFAAIMTICFVPYHVFRLIYLEHLELQNVNEVFLSLTTFNCLDMLTFLGNMRCYMCLLGKKI
ncbi:unnamed protein product [Tetraodon nigroviridis]|uniref:(spotted green pufferfish) hypothetical protein n=1 Tax=Tetraodon nigroviridis TaxID=99883 RepID=Q4SN36_TETNG|nr:unnamed protein product [Tetraodon nigroviridis]